MWALYRKQDHVDAETFFIGIPLCTPLCRISLASVDIHIAKWTAHEISLCGHETVRLALKS